MGLPSQSKVNECKRVSEVCTLRNGVSMIRTLPKTFTFRERRPKALSTGLATICTDGLVLCAEQKVSADKYQYYECKVKTILLAPGRGSVVLALCWRPSRYDEGGF